MSDTTTLPDETYSYDGNIEPGFIDEALRAYREYKSDKEQLILRIRDDEIFYKNGYGKLSGSLSSVAQIHTPLLFSCIENAVATAAENYPDIDIMERSPDGTDAAEILSKLIPVELDLCDFKKMYKDNMRRKMKYGTAVYGVFYNDRRGSVDIRVIDIQNIYVDYHVSNIQDSRFLFVTAAVDNDVLKETYPKFKDLFVGDATIDHFSENYQLKNRTTVIDCYYKKPDGSMHMMKLCENAVIEATEDMEGYEHGLYDHGMYPVVFDVCFPQESCPYGFGFIDIGKATQIEIDKLDRAITENVMINAKPRCFVKKGAGVNEKEFADLEKGLVHFETAGTDGIVPISLSQVNQYFTNYRDTKKDELKELLANRDFQQGQTSGGVTAASAIETLAQSGEKRSRSLIDDSYSAFKDIVIQTLELIRQFYNTPRTFRTTDDFGRKTFVDFSNELMTSLKGDVINGYSCEPVLFDVDVIPKRENQQTREALNNTLMQLWSGGFFNEQNYNVAAIALKSMSFDGRDKLLSDLQDLHEEQQQQQEQAQQQQQALTQPVQEQTQQTTPEQQTRGGAFDISALTGGGG